MTAKKDFAEKSFPVTMTFPSELEQAVRDLQAQRRLSAICQAAVRDYTLLQKVRGEIEKYK